MTPYAEKALLTNLTKIGRDQSVELADQLAQACFRMGQMIETHDLNYYDIADQFYQRADSLGMVSPSQTQTDVYNIIFSGLDEGKEVPLIPRAESSSGPRVMSFADFDGHDVPDREWVSR